MTAGSPRAEHRRSITFAPPFHSPQPAASAVRKRNGSVLAARLEDSEVDGVTVGPVRHGIRPFVRGSKRRFGRVQLRTAYTDRRLWPRRSQKAAFRPSIGVWELCGALTQSSNE